MALEKQENVKAKQARAEMARSRKQHKEQWSMKNVKAQGEKLHAAIRANVLIVGYQAPYYGVVP